MKKNNALKMKDKTCQFLAFIWESIFTCVFLLEPWDGAKINKVLDSKQSIWEKGHK